MGSHYCLEMKLDSVYPNFARTNFVEFELGQQDLQVILRQEVNQVLGWWATELTELRVILAELHSRHQ